MFQEGRRVGNGFGVEVFWDPGIVQRFLLSIECVYFGL